MYGERQVLQLNVIYMKNFILYGLFKIQSQKIKKYELQVLKIGEFHAMFERFLSLRQKL